MPRRSAHVPGRMPRAVALAVGALVLGGLGGCGATSGSGSVTNPATAPQTASAPAETTGPADTSSPTSTAGPTGSTGATDPAGSSGATEVTATRQMCLEAFPDNQLLTWSDATVADFRAFSFGGPTPRRPLATAFKGMAAVTPEPVRHPRWRTDHELVGCRREQGPGQGGRHHRCGAGLVLRGVLRSAGPPVSGPAARNPCAVAGPERTRPAAGPSVTAGVGGCCPWRQRSSTARPSSAPSRRS